MVTTVADLDLDAIAARAFAASPGEWATNDDNDGEGPAPHWTVSNEVWAGSNAYPEDASAFHTDEWLSKADADFIAHAREDVPALVAEVRRLREEAVFLHVNAWADAAKIAAASVGAGSVALLPEFLAQCAIEATQQEPSYVLDTVRQELARGPRS